MVPIHYVLYLEKCNTLFPSEINMNERMWAKVQIVTRAHAVHRIPGNPR